MKPADAETGAQVTPQFPFARKSSIPLSTSHPNSIRRTSSPLKKLLIAMILTDQDC